MQKVVSRPSASRMMAIDSPGEARRIIRAGEYTGHTAGIAPDFVQGNLCILPKELALEFAAFCQRNPKPCPLIGMGAPGDPALPDLGDIDIRSDVPRYRVFKDGKLVEEPTDIGKYWSDDLVTFVLGCSFSFEQPLLQDGLRLAHIERDSTVQMYRTSIDCVAAGRFKGPMVVSWSYPCAPSSRPTPSAPSRSPRASPRCTAPQCISACPRRSASAISSAPTSAIHPRWGQASCPCSGPAG